MYLLTNSSMKADLDSRLNEAGDLVDFMKGHLKPKKNALYMRPVFALDHIFPRSIPKLKSIDSLMQDQQVGAVENQTGSYTSDSGVVRAKNGRHGSVPSFSFKKTVKYQAPQSPNWSIRSEAGRSHSVWPTR
jgi:hypothetical protein